VEGLHTMTDDAFDPTKMKTQTENTTKTETHDEAGDDETVDEGSLLGAVNNDIGTENANDDARRLVGEEA